MILNNIQFEFKKTFLAKTCFCLISSTLTAVSPSSLWSRSKLYVYTFSYLDYYRAVIFGLLLEEVTIPWPIKHSSLSHVIWYSTVFFLLTWFCIPSGFCHLIFSGGPCELPLTGDLWDWEQKQPGNQGFSGLLFINHSAVKRYWMFFYILLLISFCSPSSALRWWKQWQQQRVRRLSVGPARYAHPALQTSVSLQLLRRHPALPGQQLPHLQAAYEVLHSVHVLLSVVLHSCYYSGSFHIAFYCV